MIPRRFRRSGRPALRLPGTPTGRGSAALLWSIALALSGVVFLVTSGPLAVAASPSPSTGQATASPEETTDADKVRWTVKPADGKKADGRTRIEISVDPGAVIEEHVAVKNVGSVDATFALTAADGRFNQNGRFDMMAADEKSVDAGTWIELPDSITVPAKKTVIVPFTITVPKNAAPGDHEAGVAASVLTTAGNMQVVSRVGVRVAINVNGEITPGLNLTVTETKHLPSWNPFGAGRLEIHYSLTNGGNVRLGGSGVAQASGLFGWLSAQAGFEIDDVAPGQARQGTVTIEGLWPGVREKVAVRLNPTEVAGAPDVSQTQLERTLVFWAIPWPQLVVLLVLAGGIVGWRFLSKRRKCRLETQLNKLVEARLSHAGGEAKAIPENPADDPKPNPVKRRTRSEPALGKKRRREPKPVPAADTEEPKPVPAEPRRGGKHSAH